jgi:hypothetical protein
VKSPFTADPYATTISVEESRCIQETFPDYTAQSLNLRVQPLSDVVNCGIGAPVLGNAPLECAEHAADPARFLKAVANRVKIAGFRDLFDLRPKETRANIKSNALTFVKLRQELTSTEHGGSFLTKFNESQRVGFDVRACFFGP